MIKPITKGRFHSLFRYPPAPPGSFAEAVRQRTKETQWFQDSEIGRLGVIIYDEGDQDWQAIILEKQEGIYAACQVEASILTEDEAVSVLYRIFDSESDELQRALDNVNAECLKNTGKDAFEHFFQTDASKSNVTMGFAPCYDEETRKYLMTVLATKVETLLEKSYQSALAMLWSNAARLRESGHMIIHLSDELHAGFYHDGEEIGISCFLSLDPGTLVSNASMTVGPSQEIEEHVTKFRKTLEAYQEMRPSAN
jgi:hypothetical protein